MENNVNRLKCPKCNLVNFSTAEACKRCGTSLLESTNSNLTQEPSQTPQIEAPELERTAHSEKQAVTLLPCPDCAHLCSRLADACPGCGRVLAAPPAPKTSTRKVAVVGVLASLCVVAVLGVVILGIIFTRRATAVQSALDSGNAARAGVSSRNREAARAALNAVGEIQSVTSVGTNFPTYKATIQSAKIKFDKAMREYEPQDAGDQEILRMLVDAFTAYTDAGDAWAEFLNNGGGYGILTKNNSVLVPLAKKYGFVAKNFSSSYESEAEFFQSTALQTIWEKASMTTNSISILLKQNGS
jgi:hypothetical protein